MATIFGGDEINALVIDVGTYQCRAGYAGARGGALAFWFPPPLAHPRLQTAARQPPGR